MAGYSGTPLIKKLGIKDGMSIRWHHAPDDYPNLLGPLPDNVSFTKTPVNFQHAFYVQRIDFEAELEGLMTEMDRDGMIWISWPKKASKVPTSMTENVIREVALPTGLVDVKVCAVNETWSGLKLVIRKELR